MSKVKDWIACDLRYVGETKLKRLTDDELAELYFGLGKKHALSITSVSADREVMLAAVNTTRRAYIHISKRLSKEERAPLVRAGPAETRLLFAYMPFPFSLPMDVVKRHILPFCHRT